jgi:hypothetical protein
VDRCTIVITSDPHPPLSTFGVDLRTALERVGPSVGNQATAFLLGRDSDLEHLWNRRGSLGRMLRRKGYSTIVGPAFSTWLQDPPFSGVAAVARSAAVADALANELPTIPSLVWRTAVDIQRQVEWLGAGVPQVTVDLGSRDDAHWGWLLNGVALLAAEFLGTLDRHPILIAHGPSTLDRIAQLCGTWQGRVIIASQMPYQVARSGYRLTTDFARVFDASVTRDELVAINAETFNTEVSRILVPSRGHAVWAET